MHSSPAGLCRRTQHTSVSPPSVLTLVHIRITSTLSQLYSATEPEGQWRYIKKIIPHNKTPPRRTHKFFFNLFVM